MEGSCSTGQSPQWAVMPVEEEEEEEEEEVVSGLKFLGLFAKLRKATTSFAIRLSIVLSARNNSAHTPRIFMKFGI
jgi:hypothetical protein